MAKLYEIAQAIETVRQLEIDSEDMKAAIDGLNMQFEEKADNIAMMLKNNQSDIDAIKAEEERLAARRKAIERENEFYKTYLEDQMIVTGQDKFKTLHFSFAIQNNPLSVKVVDESAINKMYLIQQQPKIDKKAMFEDLKAGIPVDGCELQQTKGLRIR